MSDPIPENVVTLDTKPHEWRVSDAEYFADREYTSGSMLEVLRDNPVEFHERYVTGAMPDSPPTEAMRMGTALHLRVLQPEKFDSRVALMPKFGRKNEDKEAKAAFLAENDGMVLIDQEAMELVDGMFVAVMKNQEACRWIFDDEAVLETPIRWTDPKTGIKLKGMEDIRLPSVVCDLKSTNTICPEDFANQMCRMGYHRKAAMYVTANRLWTGIIEHKYLFIAVTNSPPHVCQVYELHCNAVDLGQMQIDKTLADLKRRREQNDWMPRGYGSRVELQFPRWAMNELIYENEGKEI